MNNLDLELAKFKMNSGEFEEARPILERLAIYEGSADAWAYLGILRLNQLETGKFTAKQALDCFDKSLELAPSHRQELQQAYSSIALSKAKFYYTHYLQNKTKRYLSWLKIIGNVFVILLSAIIGAESKGRFGALAGAGGAALGGIGIGKNISSGSQARQVAALCEGYLQDLAVCIEQFCSSDDQSYRYFIDGLNLSTDKRIKKHFKKKMLPLLKTEADRLTLV